MSAVSAHIINERKWTEMSELSTIIIHVAHVVAAILSRFLMSAGAVACWRHYRLYRLRAYKRRHWRQ